MSGMDIERLNKHNWARYRDQILAIEKNAYEAARRDEPRTLERIACNPAGVSLVATEGDQVTGFCLAGPLEDFSHVHGPNTDPTLSSRTTLYSADTCVASQWRGRGLGRQLKLAQLVQAAGAGYRIVSGRNRAGLAHAMWVLNRSLGARALHLIENDYADSLEPNLCIYYHITLPVPDEGQ
ncbi:MAG: hypothetical protein QF734_09155 [Arenicellales bacterium]|nr:hypothetical protein [Arenicellales bacterium]MDP7193454.1 hypothetical protein [Arenicellales bacterium]MDP7490010.1 hypothetical protein [Arenicellales bacterium]